MAASFKNAPLRTLAWLLLTMTMPAAGTAQAPASIGDFHIGGIVVNSITGEPLADARVSIVEVRNPRNMQSLITSEGGRFDFSHVPPGKFSLQAARRGFITGTYDQHEQFSSAIVTGAGIETGDLVLRIAPAAVLTGKVTEENGEPVRQAAVTLFRQDQNLGVSRIERLAIAITDDLGEYEFASLRPGTYFVSAAANPWYAVHPASFQPRDGSRLPLLVDPSLDSVYPATYYSDVTDSDEATPILLRGGDHPEIDIHLGPVPALHLLIHFPNDGRHGFQIPTLQKRVFDSVEGVQNLATESYVPGTLEVTGVPAGRYSIVLPGSGAGQPGTQADEVDLTTNGQSLDDLKGEPLGTLHASLRIEGQEKLPPHLGLVLQDTRKQTTAFQPADAKGELHFESLAPGTYSVLIVNGDRPYSVASISSQGTRLPGSTINVTPGSSLSLSVTIDAASVDVEGVVKRNGKIVPGAMVILVPRHYQLASSWRFRRDQSDLDGTFKFYGAAPGSYLVIAIEKAWDLEWSRPAVLAGYVKNGQPLTITRQVQGTIHLPQPIEAQSK
ncbi:MAG TPA: carboxypeptidase-like regulatory domain-containing protein [Terriglobales bacterium]